MRKPNSLTVSNKEQKITIVWDDNTTSHYSFFGLRKNCPCVGCRGGHDKMGTFESEYFNLIPDRNYEIKDLKKTGRHAIRIFWDDGHNSGMYSWDLLWKMRPDN